MRGENLPLDWGTASVIFHVESDQFHAGLSLPLRSAQGCLRRWWKLAAGGGWPEAGCGAQHTGERDVKVSARLLVEGKRGACWDNGQASSRDTGRSGDSE